MKLLQKFCHQIENQLAPQFLRRKLIKAQKSLNLDKVYIILSFDCDTPEDAQASSEIHPKMCDLGIKPVYAVPGELLELNSDIYTEIFNSGAAEFINHGYKTHVEFNEETQKYFSIFFYDKLSETTIRTDIQNGDATIKKVLGTAPNGFRTPHFGTYQDPVHLSFLYKCLNELNYDFSSSTVPEYSIAHNKIIGKQDNIAEFPVTGMYSKPIYILDSFCCFFLKQNYNYFDEAKNWLQEISPNGGILNYYVDPAHIFDQENFWKTLNYWSSNKNVQFIHYNEALQLLKT